MLLLNPLLHVGKGWLGLLLVESGQLLHKYLNQPIIQLDPANSWVLLVVVAYASCLELMWLPFGEISHIPVSVSGGDRKHVINILGKNSINP